MTYIASTYRTAPPALLPEVGGGRDTPTLLPPAPVGTVHLIEDGGTMTTCGVHLLELHAFPDIRWPIVAGLGQDVCGECLAWAG